MRRLTILKGRDLAYLLIGVLLGSTGFVIAQTTVMEVAEDLEVDGNLEVSGDLDVGAYPYYNYLWVDGSLGKVGIGTDSPTNTLTIEDNKAVIAIEELGSSAPTLTAGYAKLFVEDGEMFVLDDAGNDTQLSSHADPRDYGEAEATSFEYPNVDLPFSFHHQNRLIGKGAVVDLAAVVRDLEALTGKTYTTVYDLPEPSKEELLEWYDWIEIPIEEAWEQVEIMAPATRTLYRYELESGEVSQVEVPTGGFSDVGTGVTQRQLKEGVRFEEETGKFFRRPALAEIPQGATPNLPLWIVDRLPPSE